MESENSFGRGRGLFMFSPMPSVGRGRLDYTPVTSTPMVDLETVQDVDCHLSPPPPQLSESELKQPSLKETNESMELIVEMVERMGRSIGESIASCLESKMCVSNSTDSSVLNRVLKSEIKEPVCFRGDRAEPYTIHEWEAIVLSYLRKIGTPIEEQADEVMSRLMGRAREVVRVGLRSNPSIDLCKGPRPIFDLLKQHFSDTAYSNMPLADFYGTLPHASEDCFDYWLRLNRAMDMAEDCLKRQNKKTDDLSRELTVMFIRHCPDPELSLIFKCRPVEQWTAADVHARLEEYSREKRCGSVSRVPPAITLLKQEVAVLPSETKVKTTVNPEFDVYHTPSKEPIEPMERILAMLERVLENGQSRNQAGTERHLPKSYRSRGRPTLPCEVCGDVGHTTHFHCRANHLCFLCYKAGHARVECPKAKACIVSKMPETDAVPRTGNE
ncbi:uncharacterized protein LOC130559933 [Triplophysa rosa]|uniref:uncharacterized protein LOC130559933 n=1 Tax=Triplophysa rosa TaxID=992332 RepID=UPI0025462438|nr:uncharacterized protein LOC130559933 [Triplophysa rosa]